MRDARRVVGTSEKRWGYPGDILSGAEAADRMLSAGGSGGLMAFGNLRYGEPRQPGGVSVMIFAFRLALFVVAIAGATLVHGSGEAHAQGQLTAWYTASLSGIPIGSGSWFVGIGADKYMIGVNGSTAGVARLFSNGKGLGGAEGTIVQGRLVPSSYNMTITNDANPDQVSIVFAAGAVKRIAPPDTPSPDRVPLTDAHLHGVTDPLSGSVVPVDGAADPVRPEACEGVTAFFNGHMRYDVRRKFKRVETVQAEGYEGPAVVCALYYTPIAGHNPGRAAIKYLAQLKDIELSLAPIANTRILAPFSLSIPTPFGLGTLQATKFISTATTGR